MFYVISFERFQRRLAISYFLIAIRGKPLPESIVPIPVLATTRRKRNQGERRGKKRKKLKQRKNPFTTTYQLLL